ncbi:MAG: hypothetical protein VX494_13910 [Actinomycetota bacterium]|nr:hypothetical protein [Actinomycetota bacterium]
MSADPAQGHACAECQTQLAPWEGLPAPRLYGFAVKDVAWALAQVSNGATYRATAAAVRERAGRPLERKPRKSTSGRKLAPPTQHGQLVSDWVQVFAPVLWRAYAPTTWPRAVLLDDATMTYTPNEAAKSTRAFSILGVYGIPESGRPYIAALEAVPSATKPAWKRLVSSQGGQPQWVVTDGGGAVLRGAGDWWREAEFWRCEWHLRRNLLESLPDRIQRDAQDPLHSLLARAQLSEEGWQCYLDAVDARNQAEGGLASALKTANNLDPLIRTQAASRPTDEPLSVGPLEQVFRAVRLSLGDRPGRMTNKTRADALLMLLAARRNGWGDEAAWTNILTDHLRGRRGLAAGQRRKTDPASRPSLR